MSKLLLFLILGLGGYYLYEKYKSQPSAGTLPTDATQVQQMTVSGIPITVYLASSGYYFSYPQSGGTQKILGPYSQAQVSAMLNIKTSLSTLLG